MRSREDPPENQGVCCACACALSLSQYLRPLWPATLYLVALALACLVMLGCVTMQPVVKSSDNYTINRHSFHFFSGGFFFCPCSRLFPFGYPLLLLFLLFLCFSTEPRYLGRYLPLDLPTYLPMLIIQDQTWVQKDDGEVRENKGEGKASKYRNHNLLKGGIITWHPFGTFTSPVWTIVIYVSDCLTLSQKAKEGISHIPRQGILEKRKGSGNKRTRD